MIKLIVSDMDGTLLNQKGKIDKEFFEVFKKLMEMDIKFVVASGRQYYKLIANFEDVSNNIIYIAENGTMVVYKGEELYSVVINKRYVEEIIRDCKDIPGVFLVLCGKNSAYIINPPSEDVLAEVEKYYARYTIVDNLENIEDEVIKIAVLDTKGASSNSNKYLYPKWKDKIAVSVSGEIWLDLYNKEANKGIALKLIQDKFKITKEETMVFGDYFNDVEMLKEAYYSYAMENAPDGVKKHANFIASSNTEKGVIKAIKENIFSNKIL